MDHEVGDQSRSAFRARNFVRIIRRHWLSIGLVTLVCVMAVLVLSMVQPKVYSSTATALVVPIGEDSLSSALAGDSLAQSKAIDYGALATSRSFAETVVPEVGLGATPEALLGSIEVNVPEETVQIRITAHADAPQAAADLANTWVNALANQVEGVETGGGEAAGTAARIALQPLNSAGVPAVPSSPSVLRNVVLGVPGGLFLGLLFAMSLHALDRRIWSLEQIEEDHGLPVLGVVPHDRHLAHASAPVDVQRSTIKGGHGYLEALRELRTNLRYASVEVPPRVIVVTSPAGGEGKSTLTAGLAAAIATTGQKVVVVDGDLRQAALTDSFGRMGNAGVSEVLTGKVSASEALRPIEEHPGMFFLGAGLGHDSETYSPAELLSSGATRRTLESLAADGALVLVDSPPMLAATDAALLSACAEGVIVVVSAKSTTTDQLSNCLDSLRRVKGHVLGIALNQVPSKGPDAVYFGYHPKAPYPARKQGVNGSVRSDAQGNRTPLAAGNDRKSPAI